MDEGDGAERASPRIRSLGPDRLWPRGAWLSACSRACSPKIRHVCTNLANGSKVLLFCHVYTGGQHIRHYHSLLHRGCLAVSTHMLVQVTRSDSSMFAHICHFLLRVLIWTWCRSYVHREMISNDAMTGVLNGYRSRRRDEKDDGYDRRKQRIIRTNRFQLQYRFCSLIQLQFLINSYCGFILSGR